MSHAKAHNHLVTNTNGKAQPTSATISADVLKIAKAGNAQWLKDKPYVELGIREKTALGTGTRRAMLTAAWIGYPQGQGRVLAMAIRQVMGLDPNVGGIDFPWLEKAANMRTITPLATVRLDPKDGKMRLQVVKATKAAQVKPERKAATGKAATDRTNGPVTVVREADKVREAAMADIAADLSNDAG